MAATGEEVILWGNVLTDPNSPFPRPEVFRSALKIRTLSCGETIAAFVTSDARMYIMNWSSSTSLETASPRIVDSLRSKSISVVSCGLAHLACVTEDGEVFTLGANESGQLGGGHSNPLSPNDPSSTGTPIRVSVPRALSVACGERHTVIVTTDGDVYTMGDGRDGRLGHGDERSVNVPTRVRMLSQNGIRIVAIAAGRRHTLALSDTGLVYSWGANETMQLGRPTSSSYDANPSVIPSLKELSVSSICASDASAALVAASSSSPSSLYLWGCGGRRQPECLSTQSNDLRVIAASGVLLCALSGDGRIWLRALIDDRTNGIIAGDEEISMVWDKRLVQVAASGRRVMALSTSNSSATERSTGRANQRPATSNNSNNGFVESPNARSGMQNNFVSNSSQSQQTVHVRVNGQQSDLRRGTNNNGVEVEVSSPGRHGGNEGRLSYSPGGTRARVVVSSSSNNNNYNINDYNNTGSYVNNGNNNLNATATTHNNRPISSSSTNFNNRNVAPYTQNNISYPSSAHITSKYNPAQQTTEVTISSPRNNHHSPIKAKVSVHTGADVDNNVSSLRAMAVRLEAAEELRLRAERDASNFKGLYEECRLALDDQVAQWGVLERKMQDAIQSSKAECDELRRELSRVGREKEDENRVMEGRIRNITKRFEDEVEDLKVEVGRLEKMNEEQRRQLGELEVEKRARAREGREMTELKSKLADLDGRLKAADGVVDRLKSENGQLVDEVGVLKGESRKLSRALEDSLKRGDGLEREMSSEVERLKRERDELKEELDRAVAEWGRSREEMESRWREEVDGLRKNNRALITEREDLIEEGRKRDEQLKREVAVLEEACKGLESELQEYKKDNITLAGQLQETSDLLKQKSVSNEAMKSQINQLTSRVEEGEKATSDALRTAREMTQQLGEAQERFAESERNFNIQREKMQNSLDSANSEVASLRSRLQSRDAQLTELEGRVAELGSALSGLTTAYKEKDVQLEDTLKKKYDLEKQVGLLEKRNKELAAETKYPLWELCDQRVHQAESQVAKKEEIILGLESKLQRKRDEYTNTIDALKDEVSSMKTLLSKHEALIETIAKDNDNLRVKLEDAYVLSFKPSSTSGVTKQASGNVSALPVSAQTTTPAYAASPNHYNNTMNKPNIRSAYGQNSGYVITNNNYDSTSIGGQSPPSSPQNIRVSVTTNQNNAPAFNAYADRHHQLTPAALTAMRKYGGRQESPKYTLPAQNSTNYNTGVYEGAGSPRASSINDQPSASHPQDRVVVDVQLLSGRDRSSSQDEHQY